MIITYSFSLSKRLQMVAIIPVKLVPAYNVIKLCLSSNFLEGDWHISILCRHPCCLHSGNAKKKVIKRNFKLFFKKFWSYSVVLRGHRWLCTLENPEESDAILGIRTRMQVSHVRSKLPTHYTISLVSWSF